MTPSTFFTILWTLYFPLCMVFYDTTTKLQYSDEILTLILILYTMGRLGRARNKMAMNEVGIYITLMVFYVILSLVMAVNVSSSVWLDLQQQVRPYAVFYCTWLLRPQFSQQQKSWMLWVMVISFLFYLGVFLYNPALVTSWGQITESVILGQLALICAMAWYMFKPQTRKNLIICTAIMALGLFGGKSKYLGEMVVFVALFIFLKKRIRLNSAKTYVQFAAIVAVVLFFTWTKFNAYYIEGMAETSGYDRIARPESYKTAATIIFKDYVPFGSGLGTFATNAAAEYYSPLYYKYNLSNVWGLSPDFNAFVADAFYPTLAEFGIVGLFFFFVFWRRRLLAILRLPDDRYYKVGLMCIAALALESTADTSYLSGKGMGYFMLLALCLSSTQFVTRKRLER